MDDGCFHKVAATEEFIQGIRNQGAAVGETMVLMTV
jgi:hypothetical protein